MKLVAVAAVATVFAAFAGSAQADEALAAKSGCTACHKVDGKLVGPSYKEVAAKYKDDKNAEAMLIDKVRKGGAGVWGKVPMPANTTIKDADLKTLVQWILALK